MKHNKSTTPEPEKDQAQTPAWFLDALVRLLGQPFSLDACALQATAKAPCWYSPELDGLRKEWIDTTWCNPPFSNPIPWVEKALAVAEYGVRSAVLLPDNPETRYVRLADAHADTIIRMPFRLRFQRPDGSPFLTKNGRESQPQNPVLVAWITPLGLSAPTRHMYHSFKEARRAG